MQLERWLRFSKGQQIGAIAAELTRAQKWQTSDKEQVLPSIERTLELIDSTIDDNRWQGERSMLFWLREELAKFYLAEDKNLNYLLQGF